jgi:hypothetical protein
MAHFLPIAPPIELDGASILELATSGNDAHAEKVAENSDEERLIASSGGLATAKAVVVNVKETIGSSDSQEELDPFIPNEAHNIRYERRYGMQTVGRSQRHRQTQRDRPRATLRQSHSASSLNEVDHERPDGDGSGGGDDDSDSWFHGMSANFAAPRDERPAGRSRVSLNEPLRPQRRDEVPDENHSYRSYERANQRPDGGLDERREPPLPERPAPRPNEGLRDRRSGTLGQGLAIRRAGWRDGEGPEFPGGSRPPIVKRADRRQDDLLRTRDESPQDRRRPRVTSGSRLVVAVDYGTTYSGMP